MSTWDPTNFDEGIAGYLNRTWNPGDQTGIGDTPPNIVPNIVPSAIRFQNPPPGSPPPPAAAPTAPSMTDAQHADYVSLEQVLAQYNLGQLDDWARQQIINGTTSSQIQLEMYDPTTVPGKVVDILYPAIRARREANPTLPPLSIGDVVSYKQTAKQLLDQNGLSGYVDPNKLIDQWLVGDTSLTEAQDRIKAVQQVVYQEPVETRAELQRMFGVGNALGAATAYYLDPAQALPKIQQQLQAAEIGGTAVRTGYGLLTAEEASRLADLGVTQAQAQQGFDQLGQQRELLAALPGEAGAGLSRDAQLAGAFGGDVTAQQQLEAERRQRLAQFGGRGGAGVSQAGVTGLGSAAT